MFEDSLKEGGKGEHTVWNYLQNQSWVRQVIDVRKDKGYQEKDIDFLVEDTSRQIHPIEVKTDMKAHETGNIVYELSTSGHIGCFEKTQAKYIMYYVPGNQELHRINVVAFRTYLQKIHPEPIKMGDNAEGFLLSIKELKDNKVIEVTTKGVV